MVGDLLEFWIERLLTDGDDTPHRGRRCGGKGRRWLSPQQPWRSAHREPQPHQQCDQKANQTSGRWQPNDTDQAIETEHLHGREGVDGPLWFIGQRLGVDSQTSASPREQAPWAEALPAQR